MQPTVGLLANLVSDFHSNKIKHDKTSSAWKESFPVGAADLSVFSCAGLPLVCSGRHSRSYVDYRLQAVAGALTISSAC
jgi:hypothetical protein